MEPGVAAQSRYGPGPRSARRAAHGGGAAASAGAGRPVWCDCPSAHFGWGRRSRLIAPLPDRRGAAGCARCAKTRRRRGGARRLRRSRFWNRWWTRTLSPDGDITEPMARPRWERADVSCSLESRHNRHRRRRHRRNTADGSPIGPARLSCADV